MFRFHRSIGQTLVPVVALVAFANLGCTTSIAATYPHLDRRSVCLLPGSESDATEVVFTEDHVPVSNLHPEIVDQVAPTARTVFELDPDADLDSVRYLPAPYNELQCPKRFSMLPSRDADMPPLPVAAVNLLLHERRPEPVSKALAEELAKCSNQISGPVNSIQHTMQLNVYVTNEGQTVFAYVADSTLGDRKLNACVVNVLRATRWSAIATSAPNVAAAPAAPGARAFFAQPAPVVPVPDSAPESGVRLRPPVVEPGGFRMPPRIFVIPLNPLVAAVAVFGIIYFWSSDDAPAWLDELNPITQQPYTSVQEYEEVRRLSPQEILQRQREQMTNTPSQPPPAPTPTPAPDIKAQREQEKKAQRCAKLAGEMKDLIYAERDATPPGGYPQGYQGLAKRWKEYATNVGKWGYTLEGKLGARPANHLAEYGRQQQRLVIKLNEWEGCDDKDLPHNARQYAAQKPELGPGKPLEPAPTPIYSPAATPAVSIPQAKKPSK